MDFDFGELNTLVVDFARASGRAGAQGAAAVKKTAYEIEGTSKQFAPVDTGNLRNSIGTDIEGDGRSHDITAEIGPTADYGAFVELGTSRAAPQAYMGPAFDRHAWELERALLQIGEDVGL